MVNKDLHEKYALYEQHGVKEYWLVLPAERSLIIFTLNDRGAFQAAKPLTRGDIAVSRAVAGIEIALDEVFPTLAEEYGTAVEIVNLPGSRLEKRRERIPYDDKTLTTFVP